MFEFLARLKRIHLVWTVLVAVSILSIFALILFSRQNADGFARNACLNFSRAENTPLPRMENFKPDKYSTSYVGTGQLRYPIITWYYTTYSNKVWTASRQVKRLLIQAADDANSAAKRDTKYSELSRFLNQFNDSFKLDKATEIATSEGAGVGIKPTDYNTEFTQRMISYPTTVEMALTSGMQSLSIDNVRQACLVALAK